MSSNIADNSFEGDAYADVNSIITEFPSGLDDNSEPIPAKKLQGCFDDVATTAGAESCLKVYLRVRPSTVNNESTIECVSDNQINTTAPEVSNRAKYTKTEERQYVSFLFLSY